MPRGQRIFFENAHYHIMDRGNDRTDIFSDPWDRAAYLELLGKARRDFGLLIPAFVLMTNHIHLYLVTPKANLGEAMHHLNGAYAQYFNKKHGRSGHLFGDRYKYKLIQTDRYSLALARYIHLNPVKAGLAASPEEYKWSSAAQYAGNADGLADKDIVLGPLGATQQDREARYREFMAEPILPKHWKVFDKNRNMVLGDREFKAAHSPH